LRRESMLLIVLKRALQVWAMALGLGMGRTSANSERAREGENEEKDGARAVGVENRAVSISLARRSA
jgi:hypothetical protein